jgi:hypothetical protein
MHLMILIIFFPLLVFIVRRRYGDFIARTVLILFSLSPISSVLFTWLGSPDILTALSSMMIVVFRKNLFLLFVGGFLLGINHPEQGLLILLLIALFIFLTEGKKEAFKFSLVCLSSYLLVILLINWYFHWYDFSVEFSRLDYISDVGLSRYITATFSNPFALLFSLYNVLLIFISTYVFYFWKNNRLPFAFLVYSLLAFVTILVTLDQTRVFSILTFPGLLLLVFSPSFLSVSQSEKDFFKSVLTISLFAGILIPRFVVWDGNIHSAAYNQLIVQILDFVANLSAK